jgi:hypothetical protein
VLWPWPSACSVGSPSSPRKLSSLPLLAHRRGRQPELLPERRLVGPHIGKFLTTLLSREDSPKPCQSYSPLQGVSALFSSGDRGITTREVISLSEHTRWYSALCHENSRLAHGRCGDRIAEAQSTAGREIRSLAACQEGC